jgi:hypothetical protein
VADACFRTLIDREAALSELVEQLVTRMMSREAVLEMHDCPGKKEHLKGREGESSGVAISKGVEGSSTEISFEHAFRAGSEYHYFSTTPPVARWEAEGCGVEVSSLCTKFADCTQVIESLSTSMSSAAVERALAFIRDNLSDDERVKVVPLVIPIAAPFVCTYLMEESLDTSPL